MRIATIFASACCLLILPLALSAAAPVGRGLTLEQQEQQDALDALREGVRLVEEGDYRAATEVLEAAAAALEANRAAPRDRARSWFYVGGCASLHRRR